MIVASAGVGCLVIASLLVCCWRLRCCQSGEQKALAKKEAMELKKMDELSAAIREAQSSTPPLPIRYGKWIGSIKNSAEATNPGVTNLNNFNRMNHNRLSSFKQPGTWVYISFFVNTVELFHDVPSFISIR